MSERVRNVPIGAHFILKRTGDRYVFLGHKRDTPGGTRYVVRRAGFSALTTLHPACHVELMERPNVPT